MKVPKFCRYCGGKVVITAASVIHGSKSRGNICLCTNCNASVGVHNGTNKPMGTLANKVLSLERAETHRVFDALWRRKGMTRAKAYEWLAKKMNLPIYRTHIGHFEIEDCERVIHICRDDDDYEEAA